MGCIDCCCHFCIHTKEAYLTSVLMIICYNQYRKFVISNDKILPHIAAVGLEIPLAVFGQLVFPNISLLSCVCWSSKFVCLLVNWCSTVLLWLTPSLHWLWITLGRLLLLIMMAHDIHQHFLELWSLFRSSFLLGRQQLITAAEAIVAQFDERFILWLLSVFPFPENPQLFSIVSIHQIHEGEWWRRQA